jgi:hypothetical protein
VSRSAIPRSRLRRFVGWAVVAALPVAGLTVTRRSDAADPPPAFADVTEAVGLKGVSGCPAAWADYDNDGSLDLMTGGRLFRNRGGQGHWLKVRVEGEEKIDRSAIGA